MSPALGVFVVLADWGGGSTAIVHLTREEAEAEHQALLHASKDGRPYYVARIGGVTRYQKLEVYHGE